MSRIRFEWDVEARKLDRFDSEDPRAKDRRRRNILRLLLVICLFLALLAIGALAIRQRLIDVEKQFAQMLQDTVKAEVAALRIGDLHAWLQLQEGENDAWRASQRRRFQQYTDLKATGAVELPGSILAVTIDDERARVLVQENIQQLPYARLWFYRRTETGWRHIAPDYSFWGEPQAQQTERLRVEYRAADEKLAGQLSAAVSGWLQGACAFFDCRRLPLLTISIGPEAATETAGVAWLDAGETRLALRSPYIDIARADMPFDESLQLRVAHLLAERLLEAHTGNQGPAYPADGFYLRNSASAWLAAHFSGSDNSALLIDSLVKNHGLESLAQLLSQLGESADMSVIGAVLGQPIAAAELDWRDFIAWRLRLEAELLAAGAENAWLSLYDTADETTRRIAYQRYREAAPAETYQIVEQFIETTEAGRTQLRVTAEIDAGDKRARESLLFNLVAGVWKRAN